MSDVSIRIEGLAAFNRKLRRVDADLPKALKAAMTEAADLVVHDARPLVPKRSGRAAASIKTASTRTAVRVKEGGTKAPYMPWLDFGGRVGRRKRTVRPFEKEGRYLFPMYFKHRDSGRIQRILADSLTDVARKAGWDVN